MKGTGWVFEMIEDRGVLLSVDDNGVASSRLADDILKKELFESPSGTLYLKVPGSGSAAIALSRVISRHRDAKLTIASRETSAMADLRLYVFAAARDAGQRVFWDSFGLYKYMLLTGYNKQPSKWVWTVAGRWRTFWSDMGFASQLVCSSHALTSDDTKESTMPEDRCLDTPSISTVGLILLMTRWSSCSKRVGGFESENNRAAALGLLASVIQEVCECILAFNRQNHRPNNKNTFSISFCLQLLRPFCHLA